MRHHTAVVALGLVACVEPTPDVSATEQAVVEANGVSLNGVSLNGVSLNGVSLNGVSLNGVSLNGVSLNGVSLNGVSLDGVSLDGVSLDGSQLTGIRDDNGELLTVDAVGVTFDGLLSNGATIALRVDSAATLAAPNADAWAYGISYEGDTGWSPLCGDPAITALTVHGTWNTEAGVRGGGAYELSTTQFTLACRGKSIAKCVELGYKPWLGYYVPLASCVRLLRGDYCGNGVAYTQDGNLVNLYDNMGIQADTHTWIPEAEWTPAGARCISLERETRFYSSTQMPSCLADGTLAVTRGCATSFRTGAVLISELPIEQKAEPAETTTTTSKPTSTR